MFAKGGYFKVALFITPLCSPLSQKAESSLIDSAPLVLNELLGSFIDKRRNMGLLSAYIDLRESIAEGGFYEGEYLPFIALNAIILG